ncbi:MAG: hypothetical protein BGN88_01080 [Clostridiales bacterium 43-6]|nr:MAG: hypothetical protein BGN88_01080 [Clostridiales bacterium 43-6]
MQKIIPHLWFDKDAREAALFYCGLFENSGILHSAVLENTPSGDAEALTFMLDGFQIMALSAGPYFTFNPSFSFTVSCFSEDEVSRLWNALSQNGEALMPLGEYPFSKRYGWIQDRYGLSWQLMLVEKEANTQKIIPCLLFSNEACGKTEEAIRYYVNSFKHSEIHMISNYSDGEAAAEKAKVNYSLITLDGLQVQAMDNGYDVEFSFNEAVSFLVNCENQEEIDDFWDKLSHVPEAEQCGWCKDKFGVSWQIVPAVMEEIMEKGTKEEITRLVEIILTMKKIDIAAFERYMNRE